MGVNLNSNWLPCAHFGLKLGLVTCAQCELELGLVTCAQCELELGLVAMYIEHRLSKCLFTMEISQ
jgi:hypothetical protein